MRGQMELFPAMKEPSLLKDDCDLPLELVSSLERQWRQSAGRVGGFSKVPGHTLGKLSVFKDKTYKMWWGGAHLRGDLWQHACIQGKWETKGITFTAGKPSPLSLPGTAEQNRGAESGKSPDGSMSLNDLPRILWLLHYSRDLNTELEFWPCPVCAPDFCATSLESLNVKKLCPIIHINVFFLTWGYALYRF